MTETQARRYGGQSAAERDEGRRTRLREAALELFGTQGYASVSLGEARRDALQVP